MTMTQNAFVNTNLSDKIKTEASEVLADLGLTVSEAFSIFLTKIAKEKALPFDLTPNQDTIDAINELESGGGTKFNTKEELFKHLGL
jgi:DNA-damage-inducible protein J